MKSVKIFLLMAVLLVSILIPGLNIYAGLVPDTGQIKCYNDAVEIPCPSTGETFYGQDAQYQKARSYTKLGQNGAVLPDDTATQESGWLMTLDNVTGLVWEMKTDDNSIHDKDNMYTWANAQSVFIATLNQQNFGGYSDWRLPTIKELSYLLNSSVPQPGPTIDAAWFPRTVSSYYWSSTTYTHDDTNYAWRVYFSFGYVGGHDGYKANNCYVRAVRGNSAMAALIDNGNETVTDTVTGLMWQKATAPGGYTWENALSYCENLTLAGHSDWRLPDRNELQSLVDYSRYNPAIDPLLASGTVSTYYWSSTTYASNTVDAWRVYFFDGYVYFGGKADGCLVRAVRSGQSGSLGNLVIAQQPMSGPPGTTFVQWGTGFTPNSTATLHFKKPDGTEYPTLQQPMDAIGHFEITYTAPLNMPPGTYTWWAIDGVTGAKSNEVSYIVTPLSATLDVQTINPQSDSTLYENFFPSPKWDQLISGGAASSVIAADGESRLLLRIVANNPGQVTISESEGKTQQNGTLSGLDNYRDASPASSVSVQLKQYGSQYIGFAVYRAPMDFSVSGYENHLTRTITLNVSSSVRNFDVSLTLRRPPIIISHGLWSSGWGNEEIESFRNTLWNRFEDRGGMNIDHYIWLNDCLPENANAVTDGATKTQSNIREYLRFLRNLGITVTQVDYLGHSMGGQWGRLVEQNYGKDTYTYDRGYLHKLISLDTPHIGSFLADIGQFILDNTVFQIFGVTDCLCKISSEFQRPFCHGAILDLTSYGSIENLKAVSVPSHAIMGNKPIDTACVLLSSSSWVSGGTAEPIVKILKIAEKILKKINPDYGCENWFNKFDFSTKTDYVVDLHSQKGGLSGSQLNEFEHKHTASFHSDVNQCFFDLLNKGVGDSAFASGFPASSALLDVQQPLSLKTAPRSLLLSEDQTPLGEIQFSNPVDGSTVQPGDQVNVELTLTGTLSLNNLLIMAPGSDTVELAAPPYTAVFTVPADAHDSFMIFALGEGTDGNLYAASVTLSVNSSAVLQKVDVSPQSLYLNLGQEMSLSVTGTYSDGSIRNLNSGAQGTIYKSGNETILSVNADGTVTPHAVGVGYVLVSPAFVDPVTVRVEITSLYMDADFSADHLSGNPPLKVQFKDLSAGYFTNWNWNFGDGATSTEQNPSHTYISEGVYTVSLTISRTGGENTESKTNFIIVGAKGDVNLDGNVDLVDAILCLKVLSNIAPDNTNSGADVDGDEKIGLPEAIYILQIVAGMR